MILERLTIRLKQSHQAQFHTRAGPAAVGGAVQLSKTGKESAAAGRTLTGKAINRNAPVINVNRIVHYGAHRLDRVLNERIEMAHAVDFRRGTSTSSSRTHPRMY